jgi:hypothetical protein
MQHRGLFVDDGKRFSVVIARVSNPSSDLMRALSRRKGLDLPDW